MGINTVVAQEAEVQNGASGNQLVVVLPNNPTPGNTVEVGILYFNGGGGGELRANVSVQDGNANPFTITPNSPSTYDPVAGQTFLAYLNAAPANANKTITIVINNAEWASGFVGFAWAKEFTPVGGTMAFDSDAKGNGTGTAINSPTIPVNGTGEQVFAATANSNSVTSVDSPFTAVGTIPNVYGGGCEYALGRSAGTPVAYTTGGGGDEWNGVGMSFSFTPTPAGTPDLEDLTGAMVGM